MKTLRQIMIALLIILFVGLSVGMMIGYMIGVESGLTKAYNDMRGLTKPADEPTSPAERRKKANGPWS